MVKVSPPDGTSGTVREAHRRLQELLFPVASPYDIRTGPLRIHGEVMAWADAHGHDIAPWHLREQQIRGIEPMDAEIADAVLAWLDARSERSE